MVKIMIDAGHGGVDVGATGPSGVKEKDVVLKVALALGKELSKAGIEVDYTRTGDGRIAEDLKNDLVARAEKANSSNANIYLSIHCNSLNAQSEGVETYCLALGGQGEKLAQAVQDQLVKDLGLKDRGVKIANYRVLRETNMLAILVELGFISNPREEQLLSNEEFQQKAAKAIAKGLYRRLGIKHVEEKELQNEVVTQQGMPILSAPTADLEQAIQWAKANHAPQKFIDLAKDYWLMGESMGINPVIAYAQFAHETDFLYRSGKSKTGIDASWHNPCGLKIKGSSQEVEQEKYAKFDNWIEGICAHLDHLALYAGAKGYPKANTLDPLHSSDLYKTATTVKSLGGKWSEIPIYGELLLKLIKQIEQGEEQPSAENQYPSDLAPWARDAWLWLLEHNISDGTRPKEKATREEVWVMLNELRKYIEGDK